MSTPVLEVARWEFVRYVKPKQMLVGMLLTVVFAGLFMLVQRIAARDADAREVAVIGAGNMPTLASTPTLQFTTHDPAQETVLRARVRDRSLDGLLIIRDRDRAELVLRSRAGWTNELRTLLTAARQQYMTEQAGLSPETLTAIMAPPALEVTYESRNTAQQRAGRVTLIIVASLMLMAVFIGMGYIFTSITGEKQIRVTEQVVSAIPAQTWIDGKILGLVAVSLLSVLSQVVSFGVSYLVLRAYLGNSMPALPSSFGDPLVVVLILLYAVLGLLFWFAFLGAVAAMIDDPNSSTRGPLLFIPILAAASAFFVIPNPDSQLSLVLSLLPPTAPMAMPVRLLSADVSTSQLALSFLLLIAGVQLLRITGGRIFRLAMLMYGKEPSWSEVRRWALRGE